ncbi:MAG TPA: DNA polymerase III subunit gamma/tau [Polyangiaceae bacterium]|nr:DNA polymerase III subunit gamma/tau [Polyangiaceae bacterium]
MSYLVLARKWRPQRFEDLVGQDHVSRTLANAIASGRVAHAFLFTGVRGVGKTTSARILAKALNCMGPADDPKHGVEFGPTITPCLQCPACLEIAQGTDMDVREIDGASYNGVDEVRKLQDSLPYRPARDRYKIFIVDEVHMLSSNAWNAFLKTLEEPPAHVKFIFATTEVHKVPVTILSRVQRFDFKLITTQTIATRLREVLSAEKIEADEAAISIVAREAAGSMRDAMSVLDQVIAWGGQKLLGAEVARVLGVASHSVLYELASALQGGDAARSLSIVADLANQGYDIGHVARDLLTLLRNLVVAKVVKEPEGLLDLPDEEAADVKQLAAGADADDLNRLYHGFSQGFDEVVKSERPRMALEMLLVRMARRPPLLPIDDFVARLAALERRLSGGGGAPQQTQQRPAPAARPPHDSAAAEQQGYAGRQREPRSPAPSSKAPSDDRGGEPPVAPRPPANTRPPERERERPRTGPNPNVSPPPPEPEAPSQSIEELDQTYALILAILEAERPDLAAMLGHAVPLKLVAESVIVGWPPDAMLVASDKESVAALARAADKHFGKSCSVSFEFESERSRGRKTLAAADSQERAERTRAAYAAAQKHERITEAVEILGAKLKELKLGGAA